MSDRIRIVQVSETRFRRQMRPGKNLWLGRATGSYERNAHKVGTNELADAPRQQMELEWEH